MAPHAGSRSTIVAAPESPLCRTDHSKESSINTSTSSSTLRREQR
jgi:hypothetical protein